MEKDKHGLTRCHWEKREAGMRAVEEMLRTPMTGEKMEAQISRLEAQQDAQALAEYNAWVAAGRPNDRQYFVGREKAHQLIEGIRKIMAGMREDAD